MNRNGLKMLFRLSTILFFLSLIMCFIVDDTQSGEFIISVVTAGINFCIAVIATIFINKHDKDDEG